MRDLMIQSDFQIPCQLTTYDQLFFACVKNSSFVFLGSAFCVLEKKQMCYLRGRFSILVSRILIFLACCQRCAISA